MTNLAEKLNFYPKNSVARKTAVSNSLISPIALAALGLFGALEARAVQAIDPTTDRAELLSAARAAFEAGGVAPERVETLMQLLASAPLDQLESLVAKSLAAVTASFEQIPVDTPILADNLVQAVMQQAATSLETGGLDLLPLPAIVSKVEGFDGVETQQMLDRIDGLSDAIAGAFKAGQAEGQGADAFMQLLAAADTGTQSDSAPSAGAEAATAATAAASSTSSGLLILSLAAVAAAGGGGGVSAAVASSSSGLVVKGPLSGAFVFRDANNNYRFDAGEESTTTNGSGAYTLAGSGGTIVATNPDGGVATDTFSNTSFSGVLAAPNNASVVTPLTTLLAADPTLTIAKLQTALGLEDIDLLTFDPFGAGVSDADKLKVEKVAVQVQEVLVSMGGAVADSGVDLGSAVKSVAKALGETLGAAVPGANSGATLTAASDGAIAKVVVANPTVSTAVLNVAKAGITAAISSVEAATDLETLATTAKSSADALAVKAAGFVLDDFTISIKATEDVATGEAGGLTLPSGTFTGDVAVYALAYGSVNSDNKFVATAELPEWVTFDATTGAISGTPLNGDVGTHYFVLTAYIETGAVTKKPFTLTVDETNDAPIATDIPAQTIGEGLTLDAIDLSQYFSDVDTTASYNTLTYTVASSGVATGTLSGSELTIAAPMISETDEGESTVTVTASDGQGGSVSKVINITVTQDTTAPAAPNVSFVDNGGSTTDGRTSLGAVTVSDLEAGATIEISTDNGVTWTAESLVDNTFTLGTGSYTNDVSIRAVDAAGNKGDGATLGIAQVVAAPVTPTLTLSAAKDGTVAVATLAEAYATDGFAGWQYSFDGGSTWSPTQKTVGANAKFTVEDASYAVGVIQVRSVDEAGFTSEAAQSEAVWVVDTVAPTITSVSAAVLSGDVVTYDVSFTEPVEGLGVDDFSVGGDVTKTSIQLKSGTTATYEIALTVGARQASDISFDLNEDATITDTAGNAFVPANVADTISVADYLIGKTGPSLTSLTSGADAETFIFGSTTDTLVIDAATDSTASSTDTINGFASGTDKIDISSLLSDYTGESTVSYSATANIFMANATISASGKTVTFELQAREGLFSGYSGQATVNLILDNANGVFASGAVAASYTNAEEDPYFTGASLPYFDASSGLVTIIAESVTEVPANTTFAKVTLSVNQSVAATAADVLVKATSSSVVTADGTTNLDLPLPFNSANLSGFTPTAEDNYFKVAQGSSSAADNTVSMKSDGAGATTVIYDDNPVAGASDYKTLVLETYGSNGETAVDLVKTDFIFSS